MERGVEIGYRDGSDAKAAEGDFAELLVYDRALSAAEREQVEDYLQRQMVWTKVSYIAKCGGLVWYPDLMG